MIQSLSPTQTPLSSHFAHQPPLFQGEGTASKLNCLVIFRGLLFAIGAACVAALFLAPQFPPAILLTGAVLSLGFAFLFGSSEVAAEPTKPLIPGQPIGIHRPGSNCWVGSALQLLCNVPAYQAHLKNVASVTYFDPLKRAYNQYQNDRDEKRISSLDTKDLRAELKATIPYAPFSADVSEQEDPWDILGEFCNGLQLQCDQCDPRTVGDLQAHYGAWCPAEETEEFTVNMLRGDASTRLGNKVKNCLHLDTRVGAFECDGFIVHKGSSVASGHYVAYIYKVGQWWEINDSRVTQITEKQATTFAEDASVYHYQKTAA